MRRLYSFTPMSGTALRHFYIYRFFICLTTFVISIPIVNSATGQNPSPASTLEFLNATPQNHGSFATYSAIISIESATSQGITQRGQIQFTDSRSGVSGFLQIGGTGNAVGYFINGTYVQDTDEGIQKERCDILSLVENGLVKNKLTKEGTPAHTGRSTLAFPLDGVIAFLRSPGTPDAVPTGLRAIGEDAKGILTLRQPVEQEFFGHPLSFYAIQQNELSVQIAHSFQANDSTLCVASHPEKLIQLKIPADRLNDPDHEITREQFTEQAQKIRAAIFPQNFDTEQAIETWRKLERIDAIFTRSPELSEQLARVLLSVIMETNQDLDAIFVRDDAIILDPYARGLYLDQAMRVDEEQVPFLLATRIISQDLQTPETRFLFLFHLSSLGFGLNAIDLQTFWSLLRGSGDAEMRGAVASQLGFPVGVKEIDATVEFLLQARDEPSRFAATEALILLDQIARVPEELLAIWLQSELLRASIPMQKRRLAYLVKTATGRQKLRQWLGDESLSPEVAGLAKSILGAHADATKKLRRFDHMSLEEIAEIENMR